MTEFSEAVKGFTDIPIAALAAVFGMFSAKKHFKAGWTPFFFLLSVTAIAGAAVHIINMPQLAKDIFWTALYIVLFECVRRFAKLMCALLGGGDCGFHAELAAEALLYICAVLFMFFLHKYDMLFFALFCVIELVKLVFCAVRAKTVPKAVYLLVSLLVFPIMLQVFSKQIPYAVVYEHIFITAELVIVFYLAAKDK